ncbi:hypothetical protein WA158_002402 [Blastocystis sp. Blastoise]
MNLSSSVPEFHPKNPLSYTPFYPNQATVTYQSNSNEQVNQPISYVNNTPVVIYPTTMNYQTYTQTNGYPISSINSATTNYMMNSQFSQQSNVTSKDSNNDVYQKVTQEILDNLPNEYTEEETKRLLSQNIYSIDVECVATGVRHCDRSPARVALVDSCSRVLFLSFIKPTEPIKSYLTPLTGIVPSDLESAPCLSEVLIEMKRLLPSDCILVGQCIKHDIDWLGLKKNIDYADSIDLAKILRSPSSYAAAHIFTIFSLRHEVEQILNVDIQSGIHNPAIDAAYSMKLYHAVESLTQQQLDQWRQQLASIKSPQGASAMYPNGIDGVSLKGSSSCGSGCRDPPQPEIDIDDNCSLYTPLPDRLQPYISSIIGNTKFNERTFKKNLQQKTKNNNKVIKTVKPKLNNRGNMNKYKNESNMNISRSIHSANVDTNNTYYKAFIDIINASKEKDNNDNTSDNNNGNNNISDNINNDNKSITQEE